jgi:predicted phage terminase large subunit-like protein
MTKMTNQSEINAVLRTDPTAFMERTFVTLNGGVSYLPNWHIETIAYHLDLCRQKKIKRLIVTLPPRSMKSTCVSIAFPALILGLDPKAQIICVSYAQGLSSKLARDCRAVMQEEWYQEAFPHTRLNPDKMAADDFETTQGGFRLATSIGGVLTGRGGNFIIIDDPMKPDDADSETKRVAVNDWFDGTLYSRLNSKIDDVIIIVMQRLHMDDLVAHVTETETWTQIDIPAIAPQDHDYRLNDCEVHQRRRGDLLQPKRDSQEVLDRLRTTMGSRHFEAQYQQNPVPAGGAIIRPEWFGTYADQPKLEVFEGIAQVWDTASKTSLTNDFSACTTWGIHGDKFYLLDVHRGRYEFPDLRRLVVEHAWRWKADLVAVEEAASGLALIQEIQRVGDLRIEGFSPKGDKVERVTGQTAIIQAGHVLLPVDAPWLKAFLDEARAFPGGKFDDQVDSMTHFLMRARRIAMRIKQFERGFALKSRNPARPGVVPAATCRFTVIA